MIMPPESLPFTSSSIKRQAESDSIVISGISGRYPESLNIEEFWNQLINGKELSSIDDRRWPVGKILCHKKQIRQQIRLFKLYSTESLQ